MTALASLEPEQVEDTANSLAESMGELTHYFASTRDGLVAAERWGEKMVRVKQLMDGITLSLATGALMPPGASVAPTALSTGLVMLGENELAGVQVLSGLLAEAEQRKQVTRLVRDVLVRELAEILPDGWPAVLDDENRFKVAETLGLWFADTPETHRGRVDQVSQALLVRPPPPGWRPTSPDDELLRTLMPDEEI